MKAEIVRLESLLKATKDYFIGISESEMNEKPAAGKWSKKEIVLVLFCCISIKTLNSLYRSIIDRCEIKRT